jgi:hypothetical protein
MAYSAVYALVAVGTAVDQRERSRRAERKLDKAQDVEKAMAADSAARQRRQQIREARIAQARVENMAAVQGTEQSSAVIAASSNVQSQAAENIGTINTTLAGNTLKSKMETDIFKLNQPSDIQLAGGAIQGVVSPFMKK